jgi:hypothetical protein
MLLKAFIVALLALQTLGVASARQASYEPIPGCWPCSV